jgi:peptidase M28-like protein
MTYSLLPAKIVATAALIFSLSNAVAEEIRFRTVLRPVIETRLAKYSGGNSEREDHLKQMFRDAGCDDQRLSEQVVKGSKLPNVICVLPGSSQRYIIVGAHFDRVPEGDGVVDNWSGAALLPSLYESVKSQTRLHTYIFIGFTDEEKGDVGSAFYVRQMSKEQVEETDAMVNMDTLGLGPTEVWGSHSDKVLVGALGYIANRLSLPLGRVDVERVGSTDSESFATRKIPRITIHSLTQKMWDARILHSSKDKISAVQMDDYYATYRLLAGYVAFLDQLPGKDSK